MKVTVLSGSPKGTASVTLQYVHYIRNEFPQHDMTIFNISRKLSRIEAKTETFREIVDAVKASDAILWATPVYYFLVPANYKRFIELIHERGAADAFYHKYTAVLTTSIHFFDHTAHNYLHGICDDLDMRYVGYFSADMYDLLKSQERDRLRRFAAFFFDSVQRRRIAAKTYPPAIGRNFGYVPGSRAGHVDAGGKKVLIVTDSPKNGMNLDKMVERFTRSFSTKVETIHLQDINIQGSCLGCIRCGYDNQCIYEEKDDYIEFYNTKVKAADILVWAGTITDRYLSSRWKMFFDRSFFHGHAPSLTGKQIGLIISGPLGRLPNLIQIFQAYIEIQRANLAGIATDEADTSAQIDASLDELVGRLVRFAGEDYVSPSTFLGVGGARIFRDEIFGRLRFPFRADHKAYRKLGFYDFPQKNYKNRIKNRVMLLLCKSSGFRKEVNRRMEAEMIKPLKKVLQKSI